MRRNDVSPLLTDRDKLKSLSVILNGVPLASQDIIDIQIDFNDEVQGRMTFVDVMNVVELAPLTSCIMTVSYKDDTDLLFTQFYMVTNVEATRLKDNNLNVTILFEDIYTYKMSTSYVSRAFSNMTMLQILNKVLEEVSIPAKFYGDGTEFIYDHFVTPGNISVLDFIKKQCIKSNIQMIFDRSGLKFYNKNIIRFSNIGDPSDEFTLGQSRDTHLWNVKEYHGAVSNQGFLKAAPDADVYYVDPNDLKVSPSDASITGVYEDQKINGFMGTGSSNTSATLPTTVVFKGKKQVARLYYSEIIGEGMDYRDVINKNQDFMIVVPGLNIDRLYSKVRLSLPRAKSVETQSSDEVFGGTFVVTGVVDKIIGSNFVQFLTLNSSDYKGGNDDVWKSS